MLDAVRNVVVQHFFFHTTQGRPNRRDLCHDVDTIAVVLNHAGKATHLALDAVEAFKTRSFGLFLPP